LFAYRLAKELGKSVEEIFQLSTAELRGWVAYFEYVHLEEKKAAQKAKQRRR